jgi:hypothetical protein
MVVQASKSWAPGSLHERGGHGSHSISLQLLSQATRPSSSSSPVKGVLGLALGAAVVTWVLVGWHIVLVQLLYQHDEKLIEAFASAISKSSSDHSRPEINSAEKLLGRDYFTVGASAGGKLSRSSLGAHTEPIARAEAASASDRRRRYDSSDATVLAMAQGYKLKVHQIFVSSLRRSGFRGKM